MLLRRQLAVWAAAGLSLIAPKAEAQIFPWLYSQPFNFSSNSDFIATAAAPIANGGMWWAVPNQHHQNYGQDQLGTVDLVKYDWLHNAVFRAAIQGSLTVGRLVAMPDSGVCLVGGFRDSLSFGGNFRLPATGVNLTYFVARLAANGQVQWLRPLRAPRPTGTSSADALAVDPRTGDVWVGYDTYSNSYLMRLNGLTGDSLTTYVQRDVNRICSIAVAPDGTLYAASSCAGSGATYNGFAAPTQLSYNDALACYAPNGQTRWVRYVESITCGKSFVTASDTSHVFWCGNLYGVRQFGNMSLGRANSLFGDYYLTRLDHATGSFEWVRNLPTTNNVTLAPQGAIAADVFGRCWLLMTVMGQPFQLSSTGVQLSPPTGGGMVLACYDPSGVADMAFEPQGQYTRAHSVAMVPNQLLGAISGLAPRGDINLWSNQLPPTATGTTLPFSSLFQAIALLGTGADAAEPLLLRLAPNPVAGGSRVRLDMPLTGGATLEIRDALGRVVSQATLAAGENTITSPAEAGLYLVRVSTGDRAVARKLVVE